LRRLALGLVVLVGSALLDRIPDPPTAMQKKTQHIARVRHTKTVPAARIARFIAIGWIVPQAPEHTAVLYKGKPRTPVAADLARTAGDSSPPALGFL
jgi:hypothetical protein